jgi:hypothetical protein
MTQTLPLPSDGWGTNTPTINVINDQYTASSWPVAIIAMAKDKMVMDITTWTTYLIKWAELLEQQIAQFSSGSAAGMATRTSGLFSSGMANKFTYTGSQIKFAVNDLTKKISVGGLSSFFCGQLIAWVNKLILAYGAGTNSHWNRPTIAVKLGTGSPS